MRALAAATALLAALTLAPAYAGDLNPSNPLADSGPWPHSTITTAANPEYNNYLAAQRPQRKAAMAEIALTPRMRWFANCSTCNVERIRDTVTKYVADTRRKDPGALVQLAIFGLWPRGEHVNGRRPAMTRNDLIAYKRWIKQLAAGLGNARTAIVLEPDLAISANHGGLSDPTPARRMAATAWSANYLATTLRGEAIYLDAGSADWLTIDNAVRLLSRSGIQHVRGFALGATHYDSVPDNVDYAARLSAALARAGHRAKRGVIDTADNGTPFTWPQWNARWGALYRRTGNKAYAFDNTPTCGSSTEQVCQTIGHQPTWDVVGPEAGKLGLGEQQTALRTQAERYVDAYLWFGRGWRWMQQGGNDSQTPTRMVRMALHSRFDHPTG
ncbi:hypothetical protein GCM10025786_09370 [Nocardioides caeni]